LPVRGEVDAWVERMRPATKDIVCGRVYWCRMTVEPLSYAVPRLPSSV